MVKFQTTVIGEFLDLYNTRCSIQKSSLAETDAIWLGVDDPKPKILATQASGHGIATEEKAGYVPYPLPADVHLTTRMHLTRAQVRSLIPILQRFVDTGDI